MSLFFKLPCFGGLFVIASQSLPTQKYFVTMSQRAPARWEHVDKLDCIKMKNIDTAKHHQECENTNHVWKKIFLMPIQSMLKKTSSDQWWKDKPDRKINTGNKHEITEEAKWPRKHIKHVQL